MDESLALRSLRDQPFQLLAALEARGRAASGAPEQQAAREVLGVPSQLTRVPGARAWLRGLANVHGALLPVIDLQHYFGGGVTPLTRSSRVLVVNHREVPAGLLVDEVLGFRNYADSEFGTQLPATQLRCERCLAGAFARGNESLPVLSLRLLVENPEFLDAAV